MSSVHKKGGRKARGNFLGAIAETKRKGRPFEARFYNEMKKKRALGLGSSREAAPELALAYLLLPSSRFWVICLNRVNNRRGGDLNRGMSAATNRVLAVSLRVRSDRHSWMWAGNNIMVTSRTSERRQDAVY